MGETKASSNLTVTEIVRGNRAEFTHAVDGNLWYCVREPRFDFPVPFEDTKGAVFNRTEKAITLMRWIRRHLEYIQQAVPT